MNKILLKGYYGFGNLGDDILMIVSYKLLREKFPESDFFLFSNNTKNLRGFTNREDYNHYVFDLLGTKPKLIDWTYRGYFNLIFNGGGGVYFDSHQGHWLFSIINWTCRALGVNKLNLAVRFFRWLLKKPNRIQCERQVGFGIGIGPYLENSRLLWRHLVEIGRHNTLFVRDNKSLKFLLEFGFTGNRLVGTDIAFLSEYWGAPVRIKSINRKFSKRLCIVLQDWPVDRERKFKTVIEFARTVEAEEVTFLSFDKNQDREYISMFSDKFQFIVWDPEKIQLTEFLSMLSSYDAIITARAHGAILGAIMGVIPICLGTSQKLVEVSKFFPSGGLLLDNNFTIEDLVKTWKQVSQNYQTIFAGLINDVKANEAVAQRDKEKLFKLL